MSGFDRADLSLPENMPPSERATPEAGAKAVDTEEDARQTRTLHTGGAAAAVGMAAAGVVIASGGAAAPAVAAAAVGAGAAGGIAYLLLIRVEPGRAGGTGAKGGERPAGFFGARSNAEKRAKAEMILRAAGRTGLEFAVMSMRNEDEKYDRAFEDSFPVSDPPANSGIVGPRAARPARRRASRERDPDSGSPKDTPTHELPRRPIE